MNKRFLEEAKNDYLVHINAKIQSQTQTHIHMLDVKLQQLCLKFCIYMYNGDLRNCIKSFEKYKEVSCDLLEKVEEQVEQDVCQESQYLGICKRLKKYVEDISTLLTPIMKCYKGGCGCCRWCGHE